MNAFSSIPKIVSGNGISSCVGNHQVVEVQVNNFTYKVLKHFTTFTTHNVL
jgi:hypothetical protein